jgi:hypothetical protein
MFDYCSRACDKSVSNGVVGMNKSIGDEAAISLLNISTALLQMDVH